MSEPKVSRRQMDATASFEASQQNDSDETIGAHLKGATNSIAFGLSSVPGDMGMLGPYRIVKELGHGGMGVVYAAIDTRLDRKLALKVMLPEFAANSAAKERFLREARSAAKITHDNVVTVYEADERQGVPYLAMQYLEGYPLDGYLKKKGNPSIPQVVRIATEAALGLGAAHKLGLIHRDVKPGNIWLESPLGRVKVLDFGLAKPVDAEVELTNNGAIVGTPTYMSPEQARGEKVDSRSDLFSLGVMLYRLCTGALPFNGSNTMAMLMALGTQDPTPVRELNPQVPEVLAVLIHKLLSKKADDRPQSADELVKRLRAIAKGISSTQSQPAISAPVASGPQIVYVPVQVTAAPENMPNAFSDIDITKTVTTLPQTEGEPIRKKPRGKNGQWIAAGFLSLLAAVLLSGVIIIIKNKDGTETKIEVPEGATITVKGKDGQELAKVGPGGKELPPNAVTMDTDRKAAEYVLSIGGAVRINDLETDIKTLVELPKERFKLTVVDLAFNTKVTDAGLAHLEELKSLTTLNLQGTLVSDAGVTDLKELKRLTDLRIINTKITLAKVQEIAIALPKCFIEHDGGAIQPVDVDRKAAEWLLNRGAEFGCNSAAGYFQVLYGKKTELPAGGITLANFKLTSKEFTADADLECFRGLKKLDTVVLAETTLSDAGVEVLITLPNLQKLYLNGTKITDASLTGFGKMPTLVLLHLRGTKVTDVGVKALAAALPNCKIEHDGGVIEPKK